jgi:hypothetical protein
LATNVGARRLQAATATLEQTLAEDGGAPAHALVDAIERELGALRDWVDRALAVPENGSPQ